MISPRSICGRMTATPKRMMAAEVKPERNAARSKRAALSGLKRTGMGREAGGLAGLRALGAVFIACAKV